VKEADFGGSKSVNFFDLQMRRSTTLKDLLLLIKWNNFLINGTNYILNIDGVFWKD